MALIICEHGVLNINSNKLILFNGQWQCRECIEEEFNNNKRKIVELEKKNKSLEETYGSLIINNLHKDIEDLKQKLEIAEFIINTRVESKIRYNEYLDNREKFEKIKKIYHI